MELVTALLVSHLYLLCSSRRRSAPNCGFRQIVCSASRGPRRHSSSAAKVVVPNPTVLLAGIVHFGALSNRIEHKCLLLLLLLQQQFSTSHTSLRLYHACPPVRDLRSSLLAQEQCIMRYSPYGYE